MGSSSFLEVFLGDPSSFAVGISPRLGVRGSPFALIGAHASAAGAAAAAASSIPPPRDCGGKVVAREAKAMGGQSAVGEKLSDGEVLRCLGAPR